MCACLSHTLRWGPGPKPRDVPWLGIELATLLFTGQHSIHWATRARDISLFDSSYPSGCEVISYWGFNWWLHFTLAFYWWLMMSSLFFMYFWPFLYLPWKKVYLILCHFKFFNRFYFFIFRDRGREGDGEGDKHWCGREILINCPLNACNPGMCPDLALNWWPFGLWGDAQSIDPHQPWPLSF